MKVVCAANRMPDGSLLLGVRHWDNLMHDQCSARYGDEKNFKHSEVEQGFVTSNREFLTREQALILTKLNGQAQGKYSKTELFSEDLY